ncbi:unnamed protein product, partial [Oikopleura dioica]
AKNSSIFWHSSNSQMTSSIASSFASLFLGMTLMSIAERQLGWYSKARSEIHLEIMMRT